MSFPNRPKFERQPSKTSVAQLRLQAEQSIKKAQLSLPSTTKVTAAELSAYRGEQNNENESRKENCEEGVEQKVKSKIEELRIQAQATNSKSFLRPELPNFSPRDNGDHKPKIEPEVLPVSKLRLMVGENIQAVLANGPSINRKYVEIEGSSPTAMRQPGSALERSSQPWVQNNENFSNHAQNVATVFDKSGPHYDYVNPLEVLEDLDSPPPLPPRKPVHIYENIPNPFSKSKHFAPIKSEDLATPPRSSSPSPPELPPRCPRVMKPAPEKTNNHRPKSTYLNVLEDGMASVVQGFTTLSNTIRKAGPRRRSRAMIEQLQVRLHPEDATLRPKSETVNNIANVAAESKVKTLPKGHKIHTPPLPPRPIKNTQGNSKTTPEILVTAPDRRSRPDINKLQIKDDVKLKIAESIKFLNQSPQLKTKSANQEDANQPFTFPNENRNAGRQIPNGSSGRPVLQDSSESSRSSFDSVDGYDERRNSSTTIYDILDNYGNFSEQPIYDDVYEGDSDFSDVEETSDTKLSNIIRELIATEENFIKVLNIIMQYKEAVKARYPHGPSEVTSDLFGNVDQLLEASKEFLKLLKRRSNVARVVSAFIHSEPMLELYTVYTRNKPTSAVCYDKYKIIIAAIQKEIGEPIGLSVHLLAPIQRPGKYILFLDRIKNELRKVGSNCDYINSAIDKLKTSVRKSNDLLAIDSIKSCQIDLASEGSVIMRQDFQMVEPAPLTTVVFLFEKVIVFTIDNSSSDREIFLYFRHIFFKDLKLNPLTHDINKIQFMDYSKSKELATNHTITLQAKKADDKKQWIDIIEKLLWEQFQQIRATRNQAQMMTKVLTHEAEEYIRTRRPLHLMTK